MVLMSNAVKQAQELLLRVERKYKRIGIVLNSKKTKTLFLNVDLEQLKTKLER